MRRLNEDGTLERTTPIQDSVLRLIVNHGQPWLSNAQIGIILGHPRAGKITTSLVNRGFVIEDIRDSKAVYRPTAKGIDWANNPTPRTRPPRKITDQDLQEARRLRMLHWSWEAIARKLGFSANGIRKALAAAERRRRQERERV